MMTMVFLDNVFYSKYYNLSYQAFGKGKMVSCDRVSLVKSTILVY